MGEEITPDSLLERIAHAPTVRPAHGAVIPDRYEVHGVLGEGGFGTVYDVLDTERGERIALKTLHHVAPDALVRFKREFRSLVDLRHPHLVRLFELAGDGRELFFTMEQVSGARPFEAWVEGDEARLRDGLRQLVEGLAELHAAGVLHRDLKSSNVLVDDTGRVVLVDFGLAREVAADGSTQLAGTPLYMAPEQCAEGELGPAVDVYALGVMLFHALAGRYPFEGSSLVVLVAKQTTDPPSLGELSPDAPADLVALVDTMLRRDPAARPTTAALLEQLGGRQAPKAAEELFVGRDAERARLLELVRARRGLLVRIEGPSGIGKTALLDRLCEDLDDVWILRGRCHPRESVPYKAFDEVVDQLARRLAKHPDAAALFPRDVHALGALFPVLRTGKLTHEPVDRSRGLSALRELFARLADRRTVLIAIDDLQWGDADSARLLVELLRHPDPPALTVVATARDTEVGALATTLESLVDADVELHSETIALGPLDPAQARALAQALAADEGRADTIAVASEGHPLFLAELARGGEDDDLAGLLGRRIEAVPEAYVDTLHLVAIAGHDLGPKTMASALGAPVDAAIEALVAERLLRETPSGVRVYHDRVGELVFDRLDAGRRRELRGRLAAALIDADGDPEQIAAHLDAADDPRAPEYLERAASRASATFAYRKAAALYARTLDLRRRAGIEREEAYALEAARARALRSSGRARDAAEAHLAAADLAPVDEARALRAEAAMLLALGGHLDRSIAVFSAVLAEVGVRLPRTQLEAVARAAAERARGWLRSRDRSRPPTPEQRSRLDALYRVFFVLLFTRPVYGVAASAMFVAEAEGLDSPVDRFHAACIESILEVSRGGAAAHGAAVDRIARGYAEVAHLGDPRHAMERRQFEGLVHNFGMRLVDAQGALTEAVEIAERHGFAWEIGPMAARGLLTSSYYILGDVPSARHAAPRLVVDANERDQLLVWILVAFHNWWVRAFRDGPELAGRARAEIAARWQARGNELQDWWMRIGDFNIRMIEGDAEGAHRGISQSFLEGWKQRAFASRFHYLEGRMMVGRGALALATVDEARRPKLLEEVASVCEELRAERSAWTLALAIGLEAGVTSLGDDPAATHAALQRTIAAADEAGLVFIAASARLELSLMDDDADLRAEAMRFFEAGQVVQPAWGTRYMLPGRFRVHEMR